MSAPRELKQDKDIKSATICGAYKYYRGSRGEAVGGVVDDANLSAIPTWRSIMASGARARATSHFRFQVPGKHSASQAIKQVGTNKAGANVLMRGYH